MLYLSYEKNENKQKEARFGSFFKESTVTMSKVIATDSDVFYGTVICVITSFIELVPGCYFHNLLFRSRVKRLKTGEELPLFMQLFFPIEIAANLA